jgi:hypothetical protein
MSLFYHTKIVILHMIQMVNFFICLLFMHPLHLGVIHLDVYEDKVANIEIRVFTDDLENAVSHLSNSKFTVNYNDENSLKQVQDYVESNLNLFIKERPLELNIVSIEPDRDVTKLIFEATLTNVNSLKVCCEMFYELFRDQTNLLIVKSPKTEDGYRLDQNKKCIIVDL